MKRRLYALGAALLLAGCAASPPAYQAPAKVNFGVIESIKPIKLDASSQGGGNTGQIFGQVGGGSIGVGRGAVFGMVLGGVIGGTAGREAGIASKPGLEIWVKLENIEQSVYAMQPGTPDSFKVGQRVRVTRRGNVAQVEAVPVDMPASAVAPASAVVAP